jgi:hypothetical protein
MFQIEAELDSSLIQSKKKETKRARPSASLKKATIRSALLKLKKVSIRAKGGVKPPLETFPLY